MDDDEAEGVLLVLGEALEWFPIPEMAKVFGARVGSARYGYGPLSGTPLFRAVYAPTLDFAQRADWVFREYPTPTAARAACEHHYATGEWE